MTRFFVNEREIPPPLDVTSLDRILKYVEDGHLPPNSIIRQIHVDGFPLIPDTSPEDPPQLIEHIENREKVEIFTGTLPEIAHDSIADAIAYLQRIETVIPSLAAGFQISPGPEAFERLRELYEGFYWLNLLMDKLETGFHITSEDVVVRDVPAREYHRRFISILKQLIDSQERGDLVLVSDLLEYEILPLMPIWKEMFSIIAGKLSTAQ